MNVRIPMPKNIKLLNRKGGKEGESGNRNIPSAAHICKIARQSH